MPDGADASVYRGLLATIGGANSEDALLDAFAETLREFAGVDGCDLFFLEPDGSLLMRASTYTPEYALRCRLGRGLGLVGSAALSGEPAFVFESAHAHRKYVSYPGVDERDDEGFAAIPMALDGVTIGVTALFTKSPWTLNATRQAEIVALVDAVAQAYEAYRSVYRLGSQSSPLAAASQVSRTIASSPYLEEILQLLVNMTAQQFGYAVCTVRLLDERRGELILRATQASARAYQRKPAIRLGESIAGRAISENRPVVVKDVALDPDYIGHDLAAEQGLRSMVCIPLTVQDRSVGVISCYTSDLHDFTTEEIAALETIAKQAAFAIERAKLQVRSTLLQEMHHRVKNNLQQVASLLRLQMHHGSYQSMEEALQDSLGRILAISAVHDLLARDDLDHVGARAIVEHLVHIQRDSLMAPGRDIRFDIRGDDAHLNTTQATQVALIMNELLQNAIVHGYRESPSGEVRITIEAQESDVGLWVANHGDALDPSFSIQDSSHLGLKIVDNLVRNMGGKFVLEDRLGWTVAEVRFQRTTGE